MEGASLAGNVQINVDDGCQVTWKLRENWAATYKMYIKA